MDIAQIMASVLVIAGAAILVKAISLAGIISQRFNKVEKLKAWRILRVLMLLFLLGYIAAVFAIYTERKELLELMTGLVFALGAAFVLLMMKTNRETFDYIESKDERFKHLVNEVQDYAIIMLDAEGYIRSWNRGAQNIKGYTRKEVIGSSFRKFYSENDCLSDKPGRLLKLAYEEGRAQDEGWRVRKDGSQFWANVAITAIHNHKGQVIGYSKVTRDLTERKAAEDATREHLRMLESKNKELEQFTYIASHDLQEPLNTLQSLVEILSADYEAQLDDTGKQTMTYLSDTAGRMSLLIKGLLDYGRIGHNSEKEKVDCTRMLLEIQQDLSGSLNKRQAELHFGALPRLNAYHTDLRLLLQNLISNAIKFNRPGVNPRVRVTAVQEKDFWHFTVTDNGIGISEEHQDRIFTLFQRIHNRDMYEGTGIGLAHCRKIVELHGGQIWVESEPGVGSTFHFTIPINENDEKEVELHLAS